MRIVKETRTTIEMTTEGLIAPMPALALREDRLCGRIGCFVHLCTENMICDGLTKQGTFPQLMRLVTTGYLVVRDVPNKPIRLRVLQKRYQYTEEDLVTLDH